jgi:hypothetical protein
VPSGRVSFFKANLKERRVRRRPGGGEGVNTLPHEERKDAIATPARGWNESLAPQTQGEGGGRTSMRKASRYFMSCRLSYEMRSLGALIVPSAWDGGRS